MTQSNDTCVVARQSSHVLAHVLPHVAWCCYGSMISIYLCRLWELVRQWDQDKRKTTCWAFLTAARNALSHFFASSSVKMVCLPISLYSSLRRCKHKVGCPKQCLALL
jgi:hypothetical protein